MPNYDFDPTATATSLDGFSAESNIETSAPVVMAEWNGKEWSVNSKQIKHLGEISTSFELEEKTNDDKEGSAPTKTTTLKPQEFEFSFSVSGYAGVDVREEYESWTELVGQYAPFNLGGKRFGPANIQLLKVSLSDGQINDFGEIFSGTISVSFKEYAPEASKDKETKSTKSSTKNAAGLQSATKKTSAKSVGASTADKAKKKAKNSQLT